MKIRATVAGIKTIAAPSTKLNIKFDRDGVINPFPHIKQNSLLIILIVSFPLEKPGFDPEGLKKWWQSPAISSKAGTYAVSIR